MFETEEATKQIANHISQYSRKDLSERSRKIAEEELAKMRKLFKNKKQVSHGSQSN